MEGAIRKLGLFLKTKASHDTQQNEFIEELNKLALKIKEVEMLFDLTYDPDMTEAYIYELRALNVKYNSVLKKAKLSGSSTGSFSSNPVFE